MCNKCITTMKLDYLFRSMAPRSSVLPSQFASVVHSHRRRKKTHVPTNKYIPTHTYTYTRDHTSK